ncbi:tannase/feruloyl esterase family alpha/beta hydrolase, partial [Jatrophihabitans sp.]|uniref:tannase/feruloyl esterase family alpha/beta hydrolase n=1 Tax=Jatrophihabitans sp. TaxID=1932789 RepID=UPI0030C6CB10
MLGALISVPAGFNENAAAAMTVPMQAPPEEAPQTACARLPSADFSHVPGAPTQVSSAAWVPASADAPAHCAATGYINPNIGIEVRLPEHWNGKFAKLGCGGFCGNTYGLGGCAGLLTHGYACVMSDLGHRSTALDAKWAYNNLQAKFDFGIRATHAATLAGKAITEAFYRNAPKRSYYVGCSTGGRQGMMEAQRYPEDFDGIVAGAPVINELGDGLTLMWNAVSTLGADHRQLFSFDDIRFVHAAVVKACDMNDGVKDGLIGDGRACHFDPKVLQCK